MSTFADFALLASLQRTLKEKNLKKPTEIQERIIPLMLAGKSVVGISETGSGKTLAYALPLLHILKTLETQGSSVSQEATPRAVVMVPTRELGDQIAKVFKTLTHDTRLRVRTALGGVPLVQARKNVSGQFEILLATPGRLVQLMKQKLIHLDDVQMLIFDEADQMMDDTFKQDSHMIAEACPDELLLGLFSATVSPEVQELMDNLFSKANIIYSSGSGKTVKTLTTRNLTVKDGDRWTVLERVLDQPSEGGTMIFTNTREQCDRLAKQLTEAGYNFGLYRGDMDKAERRRTFEKFRKGELDLLISTDLASRGLDVENVDRVINYHLPQEVENYIHRVGRTARAGREGLVVNLVTERDEKIMAKVEKLK
jgi:ATP-dependent RNA helicase RhlE